MFLYDDEKKYSEIIMGESIVNYYKYLNNNMYKYSNINTKISVGVIKYIEGLKYSLIEFYISI